MKQLRRTLTPRKNTHDAPHSVKTCQRPQNRKYITYRSAVRGGPSHSRRQHAQAFFRSSAVRFLLRHASADGQNRQTNTDILITGAM